MSRLSDARKKLIVTALRDEDERSAWDGFIERHADSTIYHRDEWRDIFKKSFGYPSWLLMARDEMDGRLRGVLPLYLVATPFRRRLVSVPFRDRGGLLWETEDAFHALVEAARAKAQEIKAHALELKSIIPYPKHLVEQSHFTERYYWINSNISLQGMSVDGLWSHIPSRRSGIRLAEQTGMVFLEGSLDEWYHLYLLTQRRLGIPPFPKRFFANIQKSFLASRRARFVLVQRGKIPLASAIILTHKKMGIYAYSASDYRQQWCRPTDYLLFRVIKQLIDEGFESFDMGSDSPKQEGLLFFKRKWSAEQRRIPTYFLEGSKSNFVDSSSKRYDLFRKGLSHMPTLLLRSLGSATTKYLG